MLRRSPAGSPARCATTRRARTSTRRRQRGWTAGRCSLRTRRSRRSCRARCRSRRRARRRSASRSAASCRASAAVSTAMTIARTVSAGGPVSQMQNAAPSGLMAIGEAAEWIRARALRGGGRRRHRSAVFGASGSRTSTRAGVLTHRNDDPARAIRPYDASRRRLRAQRGRGDVRAGGRGAGGRPRRPHPRVRRRLRRDVQPRAGRARGGEPDRRRPGDAGGAAHVGDHAAGRDRCDLRQRRAAPA